MGLLRGIPPPFYVLNPSEVCHPSFFTGPYRGQYGIEHDFARLKGKSLGLAPMYLQTDRRVAGLVHLLSIGLRVLTLVEYVVRRSLVCRQSSIDG
jgi:transposase